MTTILFILSFVSLGFSQELVPADRISDHIPQMALFYVVRDAPPPHWDHNTVLGWLEKRGFVGDEAELIIRAATRFYDRHRDVENRLARLNQDNRNSLAPAVAVQRQALQTEARSVVAVTFDELQRGLPIQSRQKLSNLLADIKQNIKMRTH
jgi:hypothetical protein